MRNWLLLTDNYQEFKEFTDFCIKTLKYCHSHRDPNKLKIHGELLSLLSKIEEKINMRK